MKTKKRERLTALFLCMVMVATTILSNGSFVLAADVAEDATEQTSEVTGTEGLGLGTMDVAADEEKNTPEQMSEATEEITEPENTTPVETPESAGTEDKTTEQPVPAEEPAAEEPVVVAKPVVTEEPAVTAQTLYTFENDDMIVEVQLPEGTVLPEGTELQIRQITDHKITKNSTDVEKADKARFDDITELLKDVADDNGNPVDGFYAYHAELVKDKEVFVTEGEMNIKVSYKNAALPESFTGDSKLKAMNVKALNYTTVKDENDQDKTVVQDMKDHLTAFAFADNAIGSVQEIGFNGEKVTDFIVAWNGQDQTTEYTYSDGEVTVTAALSEVGILPRGVELKATKVEDKDELAKVEETLNSQTLEDDKELGGFLAYDIRFEKDGVEVEPTGQVSVSMEFAETVKPEEAENAEEVSVVHLKEDGNEVQAEVLTDAKVDVNDAVEVEKAEFTTESFSTFVLSWNNSKYNTLSIKCVTIENGKEKEIGEDTVGSISSAKRVEEIAPQINGYEFKEAKAVSGSTKDNVFGLKYDKVWKRLNNDVKVNNSKAKWENVTNGSTVKFYYERTSATIDVVIHHMSSENTEISKESQKWDNASGQEPKFTIQYDKESEAYNNITISETAMEKNVTLTDDKQGNISVAVKDPKGALVIDIYMKAIMPDNFYAQKSLGGEVQGADKTWWVNFKVGGTAEVSESEPLDVVFILDRSGSMADHNRWDTLENSIAGNGETIVDKILNSNSLNRIAIASFSAGAASKGFSSSISEVKTYVKGLGAISGEGTATQLGMNKAEELFKGINPARNSKKVAILLTDGIPGYYAGTQVNNSTSYATGREAVESADRLKVEGIEVYTVSYAMEQDGSGLGGTTRLGGRTTGNSGGAYSTGKTYSYQIQNGKETYFNVATNYSNSDRYYYINNKDFAEAFLKRTASGESHYLVSAEVTDLGELLGQITEEITKANVATDVVITDEVHDVNFKYVNAPIVQFKRYGSEEWQTLPQGNENSTGDYYRIITPSAGGEGGTLEFHLSYAVFSGTEVRFQVVANEGIYSNNNDGTPDLPTNDRASVTYIDVNGKPGNGGNGYTSDNPKGYSKETNLDSPKVYIKPPVILKTDLRLKKVNQKGESLSGAKFSLTRDSGESVIEQSDEAGNIVFKDLTAGTYTLEEVEAPADYQIGEVRKWEVNIRNNGTDSLEVVLKTLDNVVISPTDGGIYEIINYTPQDIIEKSVDYNKSASLSSWENRLYNINLNVTSIAQQTIVEKPDVDVMLILDRSYSMYGERERLLNEAVDKFMGIFKAQASEESQIGIVEFDGDGYDITKSWQSVTGYNYEGMNIVKSPIGNHTNMSAALNIAYKNYYANDSYNANHKQVVIAFTDGGNNYPNGVDSSNKAALKSADNIRKQLNNNVSIYSVGLGVEFSTIPTAKTFLTDLADEGKVFFTAKDDQLESIFEGLANEVILPRSLSNVTVRDYLDYRFSFIKPGTANEDLSDEDAASGNIVINGGTVGLGKDDNGNPVQYIEWTGQNVLYIGQQEGAGWSQSFQIKAKDAYIGGNDVPTNVASQSGIIVPELTGDTFFPFEQKPRVNVKADFIVGSYETTIFWGDEIPREEIIEKIFDKAKPEAYRFNLSSAEYNKIQQTIYNPNNFKFTWYSDPEMSNELENGLEGLKDDKLTPEHDTKYYLRVTYDVGTPSTESNSNTVDASGTVKYAGTENGEVYSQDGHQYNGVVKGNPYGEYTIHVVKGQLKITKEINAQYTDIQKINANQSFIFRVDRREKIGGDIKDTYYAVLSFDANGKVTSGTDTITGLKKGYYTVTEETAWSSKYSLTSTEDNYKKNDAKDLFIGDTDPSVAGSAELLGVQKAFYGTAPGYETYAPAKPAVAKFKNTLKSDWKWLSDVASAVNEFTGQN